MPEAKLKFDDREIEIERDVTTFGRASDNFVSLAEDTNVSRYHAEIEKRGDDFWLIDLDSSNGTTVNDEPLKGEKLLKDGDRIVFGGTSKVQFEYAEEKSESSAAGAGSIPTNLNAAAGLGTSEKKVEISPESDAVSKTPKILLLAGAICGLAVIFAVGAGLIYYTQSDSVCEAKASITSPETGDTINAPTEIEVEIKNGACVSRAIFLVDGAEFASSSEKPFTATLDPKRFADLSDGFEHKLQIVLEDEDGNKIVQPSFVSLAFETPAIAKPTQTPEIVKTADASTQKAGQNKQVTLIDVQQMSERLVKQFGGNFSYKVSNPQFLAEVRKKTAEYAQEGFYERAAPFRDVINVAYVQENNLDAPLGFILAMSRSKFALTKQGNEEGLWRMTNDFVTTNAYNGLCGAETLSDKSQNCAAKASAIYMKAIVYGVFEGDVIYSAAAFGKSPQDAGAWKASLPADRTDFWNAVKTSPEREQIARFFAAGIVAENPQKFGLKKDKPLSELYRITM